MGPGQRNSVLAASQQFSWGRNLLPLGLIASLMLAASSFAKADEGGVPFWLSGQFGSLAATPRCRDGRSASSPISIPRA